MDMYRKYLIGSFIYGLFFIFGLTGIIYFSILKNTVLAVISILICIVCLDNFFCSSRANKCNPKLKIKTHYTIPLFFKRMKNDERNKR